MKDNEIYYIEIICIIFLIIFVFLLFFNMSKNAPSKEQPNEYKESPPEPSKKQDMRDIKVRCRPKLTNLYEQDIPAMPNTNDIDVINKNTFNMYSSNKEIDNTNFNKEIITQDTIKTAEQRVFSPDLEKIYTTDLAENNNPNLDYNQIYNYSLKPNKGDLPLVNVPLCVLNDNMSFKLSDRMVMA